MAKHTNFECDSCERSIPDGMIVELDIRKNELKDGVQYIATHYENLDFELCPSCGRDIERAINRVLKQKGK